DREGIPERLPEEARHDPKTRVTEGSPAVGSDTASRGSFLEDVDGNAGGQRDAIEERSGEIEVSDQKAADHRLRLGEGAGGAYPEHQWLVGVVERQARRER